ncbi:MAG: putative nucleotidyltransferase substrate binding domain-containing protein [Pseudomonadota bacterium]
MSIFDPAAMLEHLPPFDRLPPELRARAQAALDIVYAPSGERLAELGEVAQGLWIIVKGVVREHLEGEGEVLHGPGDVVGAAGLLAGTQPGRLTVEEELIAHWLPAHVFHALGEQHPAFLNFFREDLETKRRARAKAHAQGELTLLLHTRLSELALQPLPRLQAPVTLREAARALHTAGAKALLVEDEVAGFGLLTQSDVVAALAQADDPGALLEARRPLVALAASDDLFAALQRMLRHHISQLVVWRADGSAGLVRQKDILSLVASHAPLLDREIERASCIDDLQGVGEHLVELVRGLHGRGVRARHISAWVSELNAKLYAKVWGLVAPQGLRDTSCLFLMGSEGRGEQLLRTDQDNGLLLAAGVDEDMAGEAAERLVEALERLGLPRCPGGIMASNPLWRRPVDGLTDMIRQAVAKPEGEALLRLAMLADARAVAGRGELVQSMRAELHAQLAAHPTVLARMAAQVLAFETPLGVFSGFVLEKGEHRGELDLKKGGLFPIMHGVRVYALEVGIDETNTFERIERLRELGRFEPAFARDLAGAYDFLQSLRLAAMLEDVSAGRPATDSHIAPQRLDHFERDLLRDALRTVERFKRLVHHHFKLHLLS